MRSGSSAASAANGTSATTRAKTNRFISAPPAAAAHIWEQRSASGRGLFGCDGDRRVVTHDAQLVAVEIAHVSAVVIRVIVRADAGRAFVGARSEEHTSELQSRG